MCVKTHLRPDKNICLFKVTLPSLFFLPTLARFIGNFEQNAAKYHVFGEALLKSRNIPH